MINRLLLIMLCSVAGIAQAEDSIIDKNKLYAGGGLSVNTVSSPFGGQSRSAIGFSALVGYQLKSASENQHGISTSVEAGFSQTNDFIDNVDSDVFGIWFAGVAKKSLAELAPKLSGIAKLGIDLGDDSGVLMGLGLSYELSNKLSTRVEFINQDALSVYQASAIFQF